MGMQHAPYIVGQSLLFPSPNASSQRTSILVRQDKGLPRQKSWQTFGLPRRQGELDLCRYRHTGIGPAIDRTCPQLLASLDTTAEP